MTRTRLYNNLTGRREWCNVTEFRLFGGLRDAVRRRREGRVAAREYDLDPETLTMRDRRAERRWLRLARRSERFAKAAKAVTAMVEMQKHIG